MQWSVEGATLRLGCSHQDLELIKLDLLSMAAKQAMEMADAEYAAVGAFHAPSAARWGTKEATTEND